MPSYITPVYDIFPWFDFLSTLTLLPNIGFHRAFATGVACRQATLTPPDTWSCPTLGLACVLMSRPISPELVLSPDFWISNTPRYFSFAWHSSQHIKKFIIRTLLLILVLHFVLLRFLSFCSFVWFWFCFSIFVCPPPPLFSTELCHYSLSFHIMSLSIIGRFMTFGILSNRHICIYWIWKAQLQQL